MATYMPTSAFKKDDKAASEIIGFLMVFSIMAVLTVVVLFGFNQQKQDVEENIVRIQADSVATRLAGTITDATIIAEDFGNMNNIDFRKQLDLPSTLSGHNYQIQLETDINAINPKNGELCTTSPISYYAANTPVPGCPQDYGTPTYNSIAGISVFVTTFEYWSLKPLFGTSIGGTINNNWVLCETELFGGEVNIRAQKHDGTFPGYWDDAGCTKHTPTIATGQMFIYLEPKGGY